MVPGGTPQALACGPDTCSNDQKVAFFFPNSSFELAISVPEAGAYELSAFAANGSATDSGELRITQVSDGSVLADFVVPPTGSGDSFIETATRAVILPAGTTTLRITNASTANVAIDIDYVTVEPREDVDPSQLTQEEIDELTAQAVGDVAELITSYQDAAGRVVPQNSGRLNRGTGFFHRASGSYTTSIASALVDAGVASELLLPKHPLHSDTSVPSRYDLFVQACGDRVAVFAQAQTLSPAAEDAAWWAQNDCRTPSDRNYFVLSADRSVMFDIEAERIAGELAAALTQYQVITGNAVVENAGREGLGRGFANRSYVDSETITTELVNVGALDAADIPRNPRQLSAYSNRDDFRIRNCNGRIGVFVTASGLTPSAEDAAWWADNWCAQDSSRNYFVLSADRTAAFDAARSQAANEIINALAEWQRLTGNPTTIDAGGFKDRGTGFFHRHGLNYTTSIAAALVASGLLDSNSLPHNPLHVDLNKPSRHDFQIKRCGDRVGVFVAATTLSPSAEDNAWWDANDCRRPAKRNFFVLSGNAPVAINNPAITQGPLINPLKGWNTGWFTGSDANNVAEVELAQMASVGYQTIEWRDWEPVDDEFDYAKVEEILNRSGSAGRHVILQLHVDWNNGGYRGPEWLLDLVPEHPDADFSVDAEGRESGSRATDYDNEDFRREANEAVAELLRTYEDDPRVHIIQLGVLGYFGEWHTSPNTQWSPSNEVQQELLATYEAGIGGNFFQARYPRVEDNAVTTARVGMGYANGWAYPDSLGIDQFNAPIDAGSLWQNGPVGGEWPPNRLPSQGEGGTAAQWVNFFSNTGDGSTMSGLDFIRQGHYSHLQPPKVTDIAQMLPGWTPSDPYFQELHRTFGYNFALSNIRHTTDSAGLQVQFDVTNQGIAPFYEDWDVQLAILDENDAVVGQVVTADADIRTWAPNSRTTVTATLTSPLAADSEYRIGLRLLSPGADAAGAEGWGLDARNTYIVMSNDIDVIDGSFVESALVGGWNVLNEVNVAPTPALED